MRPTTKGTEIFPDLRQLCDAVRDVSGPALDEGYDVSARSLSLFPESEDLFDLTEAEIYSLGGSNEGEPTEDLGGIVPEASRGALRGVDQPRRLVIAQRFDRDTARPRYLPDEHLSNIDLDSPLKGRVHDGRMDVRLMYFDGCPNWMLARDRLGEALVTVGADPSAITLQAVETPEDAERLQFRGSPSILIDGTDPFAAPGAPVGLACRIFQTDTGPQGSPSTRQLVAALRR